MTIAPNPSDKASTDHHRSRSVMRTARQSVFAVSEWAKAHLRRHVKARELSAVRVRPSLADATHVAMLVVQNEAPRFSYLLDYHRRLGIEHFIVIDNRSTDDLMAEIGDQPDVSIYRADGQFVDARYGYDWANHLLTRHCRGKWVLYLDADEFFVFGREGRTLPELTAELDRRGQRSLRSFMLDMYSDRPIDQNLYRRGEDPLAVCNLYDRSGYFTRFEDFSGTTWIKGGVRGRVYFPDVWEGPALNKTPLVKWRAHYAFLKATHQVFPRALNLEPRRSAALTPSVLLHYKFLANAGEALTSERNLQQHTSEYRAYVGSDGGELVGPPTREYSYDAIIEDGLIDPILEE